MYNSSIKTQKAINKWKIRKDAGKNCVPQIDIKDIPTKNKKEQRENVRAIGTNPNSKMEMSTDTGVNLFSLFIFSPALKVAMVTVVNCSGRWRKVSLFPQKIPPDRVMLKDYKFWKQWDKT